MQLSSEINEALNYQCQHEMLNMWKYKILANYFEDLRLTKLAKKFYGQADEEYGHFSKIIDYLNTRVGGKYYPVEIEAPAMSISSPKDIGKIYMETEVGTTESLEEIADMIYEKKSFVDVPFILEMLNFQITEEDEADEFLKKISMVSDLVLFDAMWE
jgi:ferritin